MHKTILSLLGVAALAIAGCGGDDDKESGSSSSSSEPAKTAAPAPLSKDDYISQADDICAQNKKDTQKFEDRTDALPDDAEISAIAPILEEGLPVLREGLDRLKALPAPTDDKATLDAYLASRDKTLDIAAQLAELAKDNDEDGAKKLIDENDGLDKEQNRLAELYGFKVCTVDD